MWDEVDGDELAYSERFPKKLALQAENQNCLRCIHVHARFSSRTSYM
jgi:hypothetical protein